MISIVIENIQQLLIIISLEFFFNVRQRINIS